MRTKAEILDDAYKDIITKGVDVPKGLWMEHRKLEVLIDLRNILEHRLLEIDRDLDKILDALKK